MLDRYVFQVFKTDGQGFRKYKNLLLQNRLQTGHLHLRNNPDVMPSGGLSIYFLRSFSVFGFISTASFERSILQKWELRKSCRRPFPTRTGHDFLVQFFQRNALVVEIEF